MHSTTTELSSLPLRSTGPAPAQVLGVIGGWIGVFVIVGAASLLFVAAALVVFGSAFLSHL